jgi:hypothetical protein
LLCPHEMIEHDTLNPGKMPSENRERGQSTNGTAADLVGPGSGGPRKLETATSEYSARAPW